MEEKEQENEAVKAEVAESSSEEEQEDADAQAEEEAPAEEAAEEKPAALHGLLSRLPALANWKTLAILLLIFLMAFGIRAHNIQDNYDYFFGFDSYYHARMASYVIQNGEVPDRDPAAYYYPSVGYADIPGTGSFFWFFTAGIYKIATLGAPYNKELWIQFVKVLPAFFGALISVAMFFFARELYGRRAGYAAAIATALVAAVIPSFVYRTMAGFFEEDSLGFLWMVIGFAFFAYAIKEPKLGKRHLASAFLAGAFFAVMAWTWDFFLIVPILLSLYFPFGAFLVYLKQGVERLKAFLVLFAISSGALVLFASLKDGGLWLERAQGYVFNSLPFNLGDPAILLAAGFFGFIIVGFIYLLTGTGSGEVRAKNKKFLELAVSVFFLLSFFGVLVIIMDLGNLFSDKFTGTGVLGTTIGEESIGNPTFGYKYNLLILIPFLAMLLIPLRLRAMKNEHLSVLVFFWIALSLIMAFYKLKFTYIFGLPIAMGAGMMVAEFMRSMKGRMRTATAIAVFALVFPMLFALMQPFGGLHPLPVTAAVSALFAAIAWGVVHSLQRTATPSVTNTMRVMALLLGFVLLTGIAAGSMFVTKRPPSIEVGDAGAAWKDTLHWMRDNTEPDAKFFNWWDRGHWITFIGERTAALDNRNYDFDGDSDYAKFVLGMRKDPETKTGARHMEGTRERFDQGLEYSLELLREYQPDYIILDNGFFNAVSLLGYADHVAPREINPLSAEGSRFRPFYIVLVFTDNTGQVREFPIGGFAQVTCEQEGETFQCGNNRFRLQPIDARTMESLPVTYTDQPNFAIPPEENVVAVRSPDNRSIILMSKGMAQSTLVKIWFGAPEAEPYFEEVYARDGIRIIKVKDAVYAQGG